MCDSDEPVNRLENPIDIGSLLNNGCTEFSIRSSDIGVPEGEEDCDPEKVYKIEDLMPYLLTEDDDDANDDENDSGDGTLIEFARFRKQMTNVRDDGKVMKLIETNGNGKMLPDDDGLTWIVYVHYAAYTELAEFPYDVTRLRGKKPVQLRLGYDGDIIIGLQIAIKSMRIGEKSKFLIHSDLAYQHLGVPPRIPPDATILFDIELFDFVPYEGKETEEVVEQQPDTYLDRLEKARKCRELGSKKKKHEKNVNGAISQYWKGVALLCQYNMKNDEEENEIQNEIIKLYTNLAVCYLAKKEYRRVCRVFNDATHDCPGRASRSAKLHYVSAKALRYLHNYSEAKKRLRRALKLKPGNEDIMKELRELEESIAENKKKERDTAKRMMGFSMGPVEDDEEDDINDALLETVDEDFKETFQDVLGQFLADEEKQVYRLEFEITEEELQYCKLACRAANVAIRMVGPAETTRIILQKRTV